MYPVGFLVCSANGVRLLSANGQSAAERIVEMIPQALERIKVMEEQEELEHDVPRVRAAYQDS